MASKKEKLAPRYKKSKERVTIMACINATGSHKLKLVLIGKSKNPHAFRNVKKYNKDKNLTYYDLPVWYRNQVSGWMERRIFKEWFYNQFVPSVEKILASKNLPRKAVLILDNAPSHPTADELHDHDIKVMFLPPNVTPLCQPMDQGTLASLKKSIKPGFFLV